MEFITEHWKAIAIGVVVLTVLVALGIGASKSIPEASEVATWSIQEAIFYGFCVLAFATVLGR